MDLLAAFDAQLFIKGVLTVVMGFILFVGSVYLLLSAVFGKKMGYLVLAVAFFGWMTMLSALWAFGFWSQGLDTPVNLGPKGVEPHWAVVEGSFQASSAEFPEADAYPGGPWKEPAGGALASVEPTKVSMAEFLAEQANDQAGIVVEEPVPEHAGGRPVEEAATDEGENLTPFIPEDFIVEDVRYATAEDGTPLAMARGYYENGGPIFTILAQHDKGNVPIYSYLFLIASIIGLLVHIPFLDKAEKSRKEILTGGTAPVWRGPN